MALITETAARPGAAGSRSACAATVTAGQRVLLLAPRYSYRVAAYLKAATALGLEVLVVSHGRHSLVEAIRTGLQVDLDDPGTARRQILARLTHTAVHAVVATDDSTVELAAAVAADLGLRGNAIHASRYTRRKDLARARLAEAGLPVPRHEVCRWRDVCAGHTTRVPFPVVIKPLALSGSRGVIRADNARELVAACERIGSIVAGAPDGVERSHVLIEQFLPGTEIALEGLLHDGRLQVVAVFDKPEPLYGPFFEESYYVSPSRLDRDRLAAAERVVAASCAAYGLSNGPVHAELRCDGSDVWLIEIAARTIGGQCAQLLEIAAGRSLESLVLENALGAPASAAVAPERAAGVLMIPIPRAGVLRRVEGVLAAEAVTGIEKVELWLREGHELVPLPEGASYLGFVFATGDTPAQVEQSLRDAHACLDIVTAPSWKLMAG